MKMNWYTIIILFRVTCIISPLSPVLSDKDNHCRVYDDDGERHASCRGLGLTSLPESLPCDIVRLDASYNLLVRLSRSWFERYRQLRVLDLSHNRLESLDDREKEQIPLNNSRNRLQEQQGRELYDPETRRWNATGNQSNPARRCREEAVLGAPVTGVFSPLASLQELSLFNNSIQNISAGAFAGLCELRQLDLSYNKVQQLVNGSFCVLGKLQMLILSHNHLQQMHTSSFACLGRLQTLALKENSLEYGYEAFPPEVFLPISGTLTSLDISQNNKLPSVTVPGRTLGVLTSLVELTLDVGFDTIFEQELSSLTSLSQLTIRGSKSCQLKAVSNRTLLALTSAPLTSLVLESCDSLLIVDTCAFCHLGNLNYISLQRSSKVGVTQPLRALYGLVGKNVTELNLRSVGDSHNQGLKGTILDRYVTEFLLQTCVSRLILADNDIVAVRPGALSGNNTLFNRCLRHIDLSRNYILDIAVKEYYNFALRSTQLESVYGQDLEVYSIQEALAIFQFTYRTPSLDPVNYEVNMTIPLAPSFRFLNISATCKAADPLPNILSFRQPSGLQVLDVSYVQFRDCRVMLVGLTNLTSLNMSRSSCSVLSETFFDFFPSLKELSLQYSNLNHSFLISRAQRLFANLTGLQRLDLSYNDLDFALDDLLHAQKELTELRLVKNHYRRLPLDLRSKPRLTVLDLSHNDITQLEATDLQALDNLAAAASPNNVTLRLQENPIVCNCRALPFLRWMRDTRVHLDVGGDYSCVTEGGALSSTQEVIGQLPLQWRRCVGPQVLMMSVVGLLLLLSLLGATWAVAANVSRLRFLLTVFRRLRMPQRQHFTRDAYLAYSEVDTLLACRRLWRVLQKQRGVRLLVKDLPKVQGGEEFWLLPGDNLAEKMLEHIDLCWKMVLVLTPRFAQDPMAGFTTRAALQSISDVMPHRVILLCMGLRHVPAMASLRALLDTVPERHVIMVPEGASDCHPVWDSVADVILQ